MKSNFNILNRFKFWCFDVIRRDYIKMWIFDKGRVLMVHNENLSKIGVLSLMDRLYEIDISKSLKSRNHYNIFYNFENASATEFKGSKIVYTNKELSHIIDHHIIGALFDISQLSSIVLMALTGGTLAGVLYLILITSGMGL